jgi:hypothetical protein
MIKFSFFIIFLLSNSWLQAALGSERFFDEESDYHHRRNDYKRIAKKLRNYLSKKDPYFGGDNNDDQPEISDEDLPKNGELFEGDIVMDNSIRRAVLGLNDKRSAEELATEGKAKHWPGGIVPYVIDPSLKPLLRKRVAEAVEEFKKYTCIRYVPRSPEDIDYVTIKDGKGCSSSVGRQGGKQSIHLASGCQRIGTVIHEMMHALGIIHEQSRADRDDFVKVRFDHIKPKLASNFRKYAFGETDDMDIPYNFFSVMHYSNYAFSNDGEVTIVSKADKNLKFGQRVQLTNLDIKQINRLYPCDKKYSKRGLIPDMTERDVERRKRDEMKDLYRDLF